MGVTGRLFLIMIFSTVPLHVSFAQKLVDPDKVAPEYRAAAEKRRAEQIKVAECSHKADEEGAPQGSDRPHSALLGRTVSGSIVGR